MMAERDCMTYKKLLINNYTNMVANMCVSHLDKHVHLADILAGLLTRHVLTNVTDTLAGLVSRHVLTHASGSASLPHSKSLIHSSLASFDLKYALDSTTTAP